MKNVCKICLIKKQCVTICDLFVNEFNGKYHTIEYYDYRLQSIQKRECPMCGEPVIIETGTFGLDKKNKFRYYCECGFNYFTRTLINRED